MNRTKIPYCDYTWNPVTGCTMGCKYCYARRMTERNLWGYDFTPRFHPERLSEPLKVKKHSTIFVCDMGDLFDKQAIVGWVFDVVETIKECPQHTFLFLTKRVKNMVSSAWALEFGNGSLPQNIIWGVTCTTQADADKRIPELLKILGKRWVSLEPLIEPIDLSEYLFHETGTLAFSDEEINSAVYRHEKTPRLKNNNPIIGNQLDWVVIGGMSGPKAPDTNIKAVESLVTQCDAASVPVFVKQVTVGGKVIHMPEILGKVWRQKP